MSSPLLESIGLGGVDVVYLFLVLLILIIVLFVMVINQSTEISKLRKKCQKFMRGKNAESLENEIKGLYDDNDSIKAEFEGYRRNIMELKKNQQMCFQKMGLVKYDAYGQTGGQLSFCVAMLNERNDGYILNSVQAPEGCYTYLKEIKKAECNLTLGEEEKEALDKALGYE